jgi:lysylphosphatidylglycerol synthetase-like protein (DUF2156 family)
MSRSTLNRWWRDVGERLIWTAVQAGVAVLVVQVGEAGTLSALDWWSALDIAGAAAVLALAKGIAVYRIGERGTAGSADLR